MQRANSYKTINFINAICLAVACFTSQYAQALTVDLIPKVVAAFDSPSTFNPIPTPDIDAFPGYLAVYQVDFFIVVSDLGINEAGFANIGFNVLAENLTDAAGGWQPYISPIDPCCLPGGVVPLFATNLDAGIPGDSKGILVSIAGGVINPNDPRRKVGQAAPQWIGSLYLTWDGVTPANLTTDGILFSSNSLTGQFGNTKSGVSTTIFFGVPEPSSLVLVTLLAAAIGFAQRDRRTTLLCG